MTFGLPAERWPRAGAEGVGDARLDVLEVVVDGEEHGVLGAVREAGERG